MISNLVGIVVVAIIAIALVMLGRGWLAGGGSEISLDEATVTLTLEPGPTRFVVHGTYRTTITGGARTNRYRARLLADATELAAREFSITVSQDTKVGTVRNSTLALEATIARAGSYRFVLEPAPGNPIEFNARTLTVRRTAGD